MRSWEHVIHAVRAAPAAAALRRNIDRLRKLLPENLRRMESSSAGELLGGARRVLDLV